MKEKGLIAIQPKGYVPRTTQSHPHLSRSPNLLLLPENEVIRLRQVVVGDITYLPNSESGYDKWLYLAVWMPACSADRDLYSRRILGWAIDRNMPAELIINAMKQVLKHHKIDTRLIVHSDGGGQYGSIEFRSFLERHDYQQSMTRKDNHYDNAHCESLFSRFKTELLQQHNNQLFHGLDDAYYQTFDFIEGYYNTIRKHSALNYKSPMQFERLCKE